MCIRDSVEAFRDGVSQLSATGLDVAVKAAGAASVYAGIPLRLNLIGHDRPGICLLYTSRCV